MGATPCAEGLLRDGALLREFPRVKATFNLVPSLLVQLEAFADDRAQDRTLAVSLNPADRLTPADVAFMRRAISSTRNGSG